MAQNLARGPADPEYTFKDLAEDFRVSYKRTRTVAAEGGWRAEMLARMEAVTTAAIDAAQAEAEASPSRSSGFMRQRHAPDVRS